MNELPDYELLSAYLDGELTAAEQAEVERLLATSPAARQLLDELRALSTTLQSLPQQKVGEDLSPRVLRVAERRMLTGEEAGPRESASEPPVPLGRSIYRRFTTPRTLVRLALIAVVALMIVINDRSRHIERAGDAGREIARAPVESDDKTKSRDYEPPSISAGNATNSNGQTVVTNAATYFSDNFENWTVRGGTWTSVSGDQYAVGTSAVGTAPEAMQEGAKNAKVTPLNSPSASSPNATAIEASPDRLRSERKLAEKRPMKDVTSAGARLKTSLGYGGVAASSAESPNADRSNAIVGTGTPPATGEQVHNLMDRKGALPSSNKKESVPLLSDGISDTEKRYSLENDAGKPSAPGAGKEEGRRVEQGGKAGEAGENLLVVRCDMSPEAAKKGAFDKLLSANGIAWQDERGQLAQGGKVEKLDAAKAPADEAQNKDKDKDKGVDAKAEPAAADQVELVYVEATPAQVTATLTGLSAQPEAFPSVSIQPEQDKPADGTNWSDVVRQQVSNYNNQSQSNLAAPVEKQASPANHLAAARSNSTEAVATQLNRQPLDATSNVNQGRAQRIQLQLHDGGARGNQQNQVGINLRGLPTPSPATDQSQPVAGAPIYQRQEQPLNRAQIERLPQSASQQNVLFVLRVVGGKQSASQPANAGRAGVESNAAKPAESVTTPPVDSTEEK